MRAAVRLEIKLCGSEMAKRVAILRLLDEEDGRGIVYCATVKAVDELFGWLAAGRVPVARYHSELRAKAREDSRHRFVNGSVLVMITRNGSGIGVDTRELRWVVQY
jgi:ATP-dependent DNA helicase RecQ